MPEDIQEINDKLDQLFASDKYKFQKHLQLFDERNIQTGRGVGTKIGTDTDQKLGFWGTTPIIQPTTSVGEAAFVELSGTTVNDNTTFDGYTLRQVIKALRNIGLLQ